MNKAELAANEYEFHTTGKYDGFILGYEKGQLDLLEEASYGFEDTFLRIIGGDHEGPNRLWTDTEKEIWQASSLHHMKEKEEMRKDMQWALDALACDYHKGNIEILKKKWGLV